MDEINETDGEVSQEQPSLESDDPALRKLFRQQRLKRRHEAAQRLQELLDGTYTGDVVEKPLLIKTIDDSNEKLFTIFVEGKEQVTNIRVSADTREIKRRDAELAARNARLKQLEDDGAVAADKLQAIMQKWDKIADLNDPLDLCQELKDQRARCTDLIEQKDALIKDFKEELELADERYVSDRLDMFEDISILARRIDEQVLVMKRSYFTELENIDEAIETTRIDLENEQETAWKSLHEKREQYEAANLAKQFNMMDDNEDEVMRVHVKHAEECRSTKIRLETDMQALEQELEQIKALCLVNSEKLDYNYQVLKKREDENIIIKNNQKRTLNRLHEEATQMRRKIEERESKTKQELTKLNREICLLRKNIVDVEKKADHFSQVNDRKFQQIWDMKTEEAVGLLDKILTADKIIHQDILGLEWQAPGVKPLKKEDLLSYQAAVAMIDEVFKVGSDDPPEEKVSVVESDVDKSRVLKQILKVIADNTGFLVEEKLNGLLEPYTEEQQNLVRLDNVFNAIGVHRKEDIRQLEVFFLPYSKCRECSEVDAERGVCNEHHHLVIEKTYVLKALGEFVSKLHASKFRARAERDLQLAKDRCTVSRLVSREDIQTYWARFREIFPEQEETVWGALYKGLAKYHVILQDREKLNAKAQSLRQQNMELRALAEKYVTMETKP